MMAQGTDTLSNDRHFIENLVYVNWRSYTELNEIPLANSAQPKMEMRNGVLCGAVQRVCVTQLHLETVYFITFSICSFFFSISRASNVKCRRNELRVQWKRLHASLTQLPDTMMNSYVRTN